MLGWDPADVLSLARDLDRRGIRLRLLDLGADTGTPSGRVLLAVLAAVTGWEREILIERTRDSLSAAKSRGQALGRRRSLSAPQRRHAVELATAGHSIREIGRRLGCSASIAHRAIMEVRGEIPGAVSEPTRAEHRSIAPMAGAAGSGLQPACTERGTRPAQP